MQPGTIHFLCKTCSMVTETMDPPIITIDQSLEFVASPERQMWTDLATCNTLRANLHSTTYKRANYSLT